MSGETLEQKVDRLLGMLDKGAEKTDELMNRGADAYSKASKFKAFFTSWKGIATLSVIFGVAIWITGPYWFPWFAQNILTTQRVDVAGTYFERLQQGIARRISKFFVDLNGPDPTSAWENIYIFAAIPSLMITWLAYTKYLAKKAAGGVKTVYSQATTSQAEKQLQASVDSLTEEKVSLDRQKQVLEGQVKEAKATITMLEQKLNQTKQAKDGAMKHIDELYSHAGLSRQIEDLGFKRYTEKQL